MESLKKYQNKYRLTLLLLLLFFLPHMLFCQEVNKPEEPEVAGEAVLTLEDAVKLALENNYEIKKQQYALQLAQAQYRQVKGSFDFEVGAEGGYSLKQNPVDENDPDYKIRDYGNDINLSSPNSISHQTSASIFVQKLFSFGLNTKLSYTLKRQKNKTNYVYSENFPDSLKPDSIEARNYGIVGLELSLPLFKSFKNSISAMQLENAESCIEQMASSLEDTISKTILDVSQKYYNYYLSYNNLELMTALQGKIEERNKNLDSLIRAGVRSRNDSLAMQVNALENQRSLQNAQVQFQNARTELMSEICMPELDFIPPPDKSSFPEINTEDASFIVPEKITRESLEKVISSRSDIVSIKKQLEASEQKLKIAKIDCLPDAKINFGIGVTGTKYSDNFGNLFGAGFNNVHGADISGSLGLDIKLGNNSKKGAQEEALAEYNSILADYNNAIDTLVMQVRNAAEKISIYKKAVQNADEVLALQKNLYENEQKRFNAGLITVDSLMTQDEKYISAENSYYQVLINYLLAVLEYKYYTGVQFD